MPQRHTGTGLLFSSRVLRVLLKRNTSRAIVSDSRSETTNATTHLLRFLWYTAFRSFLPHIKPHRAAPLGRTALAGGSLMGKSVLAVDARFSVCISLTPGYLMKPGLELSSFGALAFHGVRDYRQLPAKWCRKWDLNPQKLVPKTSAYANSATAARLRDTTALSIPQ